MTNKFYRDGMDRAAGVQDLFATIAPRYDLINDLQSFGLHRFWKRRVISLAQPRTGETALDICCGTGDIALALAARGLAVTGLDFSAAMLAVAEKRAARAGGRANLEFVQGDAQSLPYPDATFDIVTVSYGLRNLADWKKGLREVWRVAKPGGRMVILDFGKPENVWLRRAYFTYLRSAVPLFGRLFCGDPQTHAYIHESLQSYPAQKGVDQMLREMDCSEIRLVNLLGGVMSINAARKC